MRKYMEELNTHTTKIVKKPPQTELDKPLSISVQNEIKLRKEEVKKTKKSKKLKKNYATFIHIQSRADKTNKKEKTAQPKKKNRSHGRNQKQEWRCIECGTNPTWLDYSLCYTCYCKKEKEQREKKHWVGGYTPL